MSDFCFVEHTLDQVLRRLATSDPRFGILTHFRTFAKLKTNLDRVNYAYRVLEKFGLFPDIIRADKDDSKSQKSREEGNVSFRKGKFLQALQCYVCSIVRAKSSKVLALGYANRSACLFHLGRYQECLVEIERALASDYPDHLKHKLITRRSKAQEMLSSSKAPQSYHCDIPEIANNEQHPTIQSAKNCIQIEKNKQFGRHIVATKDIEIGEIICVEKPYACAIYDENNDDDDDELLHCHTCLDLCYNPIPCDKCIFLVFCSENCKYKACNTFHKHECSALATLNKGGKEVWRNSLVIRTVLLAIEENSSDLPEEEMYRSDRYKEISNLMPLQVEVGQLYKPALIVAIIFHIFLKSTSIFDCPNNDDVMDNFKEMALSQILISKMNTLPISEGVGTSLFYEDNIFASGLYSFASLFSHSCRPNVELIQYGSAMVARTINSIKKGQQCYISYGPRYWTRSQVARNSFLRKAYFECKCIACIEDWSPSSDDRLSYCLPLDVSEDCVREVLIMEMELFTNICPIVADKYLPLLIKHLKRCEQFEPSGKVVKLKLYVFDCYKAFGNRRIL